MTRWPIKHALIAAVLLAIELVLGLGIIGVPAVLIAAVVLLSGTPRIGMRLQVAALYLCVSVLTFTWLVYNVHVAKRRAIPVIAACKQFRAEHNRYPTQLNELIPATPARWQPWVYASDYDGQKSLGCSGRTLIG